MIARSQQHGTVHLVGAPPWSDTVTPPGRTGTSGRLTPAFACAEAIRAGTLANAPVIVVGQDGASAHAERCGLSVEERIAPPLGRAKLARPTLRRVAGGVDRIICWSDELAPMAANIADNVELVSTRPDLCRVSQRRFSKVSCYNDRDAAVWAARGMIPDHIEQPEFAARSAITRDDARRLLGVDDTILVFASLADEPARADARGLAFMLTVLEATRFPVCGIAPATAHNIIAARRHHRATKSRYHFLVAQRPPADWLAGVDFAVLPPTDGSGSDALLERYARGFGCEIVRLNHEGKATLASGGTRPESLLERLDRAVLTQTRGAAHA